LVTLAVYLDAFPNTFVWDDTYLIVDNPTIKRWAGVRALLTGPLLPGPTGTPYYRPVQALTYLLDYHLWGLTPAGFHLTSVLLHAGTAMLLYRLGGSLLRDARAALVAALLFAVHPIHTEAVTYIAGRSDPLAALLMLAALLAGRDARPSLALPAFLLALLAREAAMVLVPLTVLVDVAVGWRDGERLRATLRARVVSRYVPMLAVLLFYLVLRSAAVGTRPVVFATAAVPLGLRLLTMFGVVVRYLGLLLVPIGLHMERIVPAVQSPWDPAVLGPALLVAVLFAAPLLGRRRTWPIAFGVGWFCVALLPVANVVPLATFMAEHWLYVPSMGLFLAAGWCLSRMAGRTAWGLVAIGAAVVLYGGLTIRRNLDWRDPITIFEATVRCSPQGARAWTNLGQAYQEAGQREQAKTAYGHALGLPAPPVEAAHVHNNLGNLYRDERHYDESVRELQEALRLDPKYVAAYNNLALTLRALGRDGEARAALEVALGIDVASAMTHNNLGNVFFRDGDLVRAAAEYQRALVLDPDFADAHNNLGSAYFRLGQPERTEAEYRAALQLKPGSEEIRRNLARIRERR